MDDIAVLKWFLVIIAVAVACAATIFVPSLVAVVALGLLIAGGIVRASARRRGRAGASVGTTLMIYGAAVLLPPVGWFVLALMNSAHNGR